MKRIVLLLVMMMAASAVISEQQELLDQKLKKLVEEMALATLKKKEYAPNEEVKILVEVAATNRESAYVAVRDKIVAYDENALHILRIIATDGGLPWQQRLVARICYERIERKEDIENLLAIDWYRHPDFNPEWNNLVKGPEAYMPKIIWPTLMEYGLWYYYLELEWKATREIGRIGDKNRDGYWNFCCTHAIKDEERVWFLRVYADLIANTPPSPHLNRLFYMLVQEKKPDALPLVFQSLLQQDNPKDGYSTDPRFLEMLSYADSRSVDVLEKFVTKYPPSVDLTAQLAAIRVRPAPPPTPEPFRLGASYIIPPVKRASHPPVTEN